MTVSQQRDLALVKASTCSVLSGKLLPGQARVLMLLLNFGVPGAKMNMCLEGRAFPPQGNEACTANFSRS